MNEQMLQMNEVMLWIGEMLEMNGVILWTSVTNEMIDGVKGFCTVTRFDFCQPVCQ